MNSGAARTGAVEFTGVGHAYHPALGTTVVALTDFSLRLEPGTLCALAGPNGSGKSTVLKLAAGLAAPARGTVMVNGRAATEPAARRGLGYLPENPDLPGWLTAREFLVACGELAGLPPAGLRREVADRLAWAGLSTVAERSAAALSKGQRQRLGLAQALLGGPALLLLDEPAAGLDPVGVAELVRHLRELRSAGTTVLLSSHFLQQIEECCDRVCLLRHGRLIWQGPGAGETPLADRYRGLAGTEAAA